MLASVVFVFRTLSRNQRLILQGALAWKVVELFLTATSIHGLPTSTAQVDCTPQCHLPSKVAVRDDATVGFGAFTTSQEKMVL